MSDAAIDVSSPRSQDIRDIPADMHPPITAYFGWRPPAYCPLVTLPPFANYSEEANRSEREQQSLQPFVKLTRPEFDVPAPKVILRRVLPMPVRREEMMREGSN